MKNRLVGLEPSNGDIPHPTNSRRAYHLKVGSRDLLAIASRLSCRRLLFYTKEQSRLRDWMETKRDWPISQNGC